MNRCQHQPTPTVIDVGRNPAVLKQLAQLTADSARRFKEGGFAQATRTVVLEQPISRAGKAAMHYTEVSIHLAQGRTPRLEFRHKAGTPLVLNVDFTESVKLQWLGASPDTACVWCGGPNDPACDMCRRAQGDRNTPADNSEGAQPQG